MLLSIIIGDGGQTEHGRIVTLQESFGDDGGQSALQVALAVDQDRLWSGGERNRFSKVHEQRLKHTDGI